MSTIINIQEYQSFNNQDTALEYIIKWAQQSKFILLIVFLVVFRWTLYSLLDFLLDKTPQYPNWLEIDAETIFKEGFIQCSPWPEDSRRNGLSWVEM